MKNICFTGHRNILLTSQSEKQLLEILEKLIADGAANFYAGGALVWDTFCEQMILNLRKKYPYIKLHLILPCPESEQIKKWQNTDKNIYHKILLSADTVEVCSDHYHKSCMKKRNARLIEVSDYCICYYNSKKYISGTGQTVRMAQLKQIKIINLYELF